MRFTKAACVVTAILIAGLVFAVAQKKPGPRETRPNTAGGSVEQNKQLARRAFEALSSGRYSDANHLYSSDARIHFAGRSESLGQSIEEYRNWRTAAPDMNVNADQVTANGDEVRVNWTARGTHTGQTQGLKPTGKHVNIRGTTVFRFANGKIVEAQNSEYRDELYRQLGISRPAALIYEKAQDLQASLRDLFDFSAAR
jgi:steroid delta-isomerase-like uncharacterized protein